MRQYRPLPEFDDYSIEGKSIEEIIVLSLSVGMYHANWKKAQDICVSLSEHSDERISSNSALGLAYIARTKGRLEKHVVKPVLLNLLYKHDEYQWRIIDSIIDVNYFMDWNIGHHALSKTNLK